MYWMVSFGRIIGQTQIILTQKYHTTWNNRNARGILESKNLHTTKDSFIQTTLVDYVHHNIQRYVRETGIECEGKVMLI